VIDVEPVSPKAGSGAKLAPEGLAHYEHAGQHHVFSTNEKNTTMTVMQITPTGG